MGTDRLARRQHGRRHADDVGPHSPGVGDLETDGDFLVFADENQSVVSWGLRHVDLDEADPHVWQRNNTDEQWYDEELALLPFLVGLFDFALGDD